MGVLCVFSRIVGTGMKLKAIRTCGMKPRRKNTKSVGDKAVNRFTTPLNRFNIESIGRPNESIHN